MDLRKLIIALLLVAVLLPFTDFALGDDDPPNAAHGAPPKAAPQRRKGGESFPPLPLPATPLRRTEKKRPPSPPTFIGKVKWGSPTPRVGSDDTGNKYSFWDWEGARDDVTSLIEQSSVRLGVKYGARVLDIKDFSGDPDDIPVLYFTGHEAIVFDKEMRDRIREYVRSGGYIWAQACCGSKKFYDSFVLEMKTIFPDRSFLTLPLDHPVYHCYYDITRVRRMFGGKVVEEMPPQLEGISVGCRTAVFISKYDLGCGWASVPNKYNAYDSTDSKYMGLNMVNYCLAYHKLGKFLATSKVYYESDANERADFTMGQVIHAGEWDPHPSGLASLLKAVLSNTSTEVKFKRTNVNLDEGNFFSIPLLYLSGHGEFSLSAKSADALRRYLEAGGMLFADSCCGELSFDNAFRREMRRVMPTAALSPVPASHELFSSLFTIREVTYSPLLIFQKPDLKTPEIEGIEINGKLAVIYSHYGIGTSWDGEERPFAKAWSRTDSLKFGINLVVYAQTH
ncbi:MAG: DUF4159 domain-containing protein [Candidatus Brocadiia bacterium]